MNTQRFSSFFSSHHNNSDDEHSPLLSNNNDGSNQFPRDLYRPIVFFALLITFVEAGSIMERIPLNEVLEDIICQNLPKRNTTELIQCGNDRAVQAGLAFLLAWKSTISVATSLFTAIPYGFVADRCGHKLTIILSVLGITLAGGCTLVICWWSELFPLRLIPAAPLFTLIGGGPQVLNAIILADLSSLVQPEYRSTTFSYFAAHTLLVRFAGNLLAAQLMKYHVWIPIWIGFACAATSVLIAIFLPEMPKDKQLRQQPPDNVRAPSSHSEPNEELLGKDTTLKIRILAAIVRFKESAIFLVHRSNDSMLVLMLVMVMMTIAGQSISILPQLVRNKYGWPWSTISYIFSLETAVSIFVLLVIMPGASQLICRSVSITPFYGDLHLTRASCAFVAAGTLIIALSNKTTMMLLGVVVFYLGCTSNILLRSLLAGLADDDSVILFNCMACLETIGSMISGPAMAMLLKAGLNIGGVMAGLPFMFSGLMSFFAVVMLTKF